MADYFENMCIKLPLKKRGDRKKRLWWWRVKDALQTAYDGDSAEQAFLEELLPPEALECTVCDILIEDDAVYLMDDGGVLQSDGVVGILQTYLKEFDPAGVICVEIAFTCSKHRPDAFGGVAIAVTADAATHKSLTTVCEEMMKERNLSLTDVRNTR